MLGFIDESSFTSKKGEVFDSAIETPAEFVLGAGRVVEGLELGYH
jgi:FKBP-type peptidyl-prolyl cis-trans isomerase 2